jgi:hypothetical protein
MIWAANGLRGGGRPLGNGAMLPRVQLQHATGRQGAPCRSPPALGFATKSPPPAHHRARRSAAPLISPATSASVCCCSCCARAPSSAPAAAAAAAPAPGAGAPDRSRFLPTPPRAACCAASACPISWLVVSMERRRALCCRPCGGGGEGGREGRSGVVGRAHQDERWAKAPASPPPPLATRRSRRACQPLLRGPPWDPGCRCCRLPWCWPSGRPLPPAAATWCPGVAGGGGLGGGGGARAATRDPVWLPPATPRLLCAAASPASRQAACLR